MIANSCMEGIMVEVLTTGRADMIANRGTKWSSMDFGLILGASAVSFT